MQWSKCEVASEKCNGVTAMVKESKSNNEERKEKIKERKEGERKGKKKGKEKRKKRLKTLRERRQYAKKRLEVIYNLQPYNT